MNIPQPRLLVILGLMALLGGGYLVLAAGFWNRGLPEGLIQVNGRIEGDHLTIASKFPGRIQVVEVFGTLVDSERTAERVKPRIGFLPQGLGLNLYPELSVEENIDFFARLRLLPEQELVERKARFLAITRLDKFRDRAMKHLSGGMKQKLGHHPDSAISGKRRLFRGNRPRD
jgi:energy-coupling factor transporter ATP-binding protein EcfA2